MFGVDILARCLALTLDYIENYRRNWWGDLVADYTVLPIAIGIARHDVLRPYRDDSVPVDSGLVWSL